MSDVTGAGAWADRDAMAVFWQLADAMPALVWTADAIGTVTAASRSFFEYIGTDDVDLLAGEWMQSIHPDDLDGAVAAWSAAAASGEPYSSEFRLRRHDGQYRWHLFTSNPSTDAQGRVAWWSGTGIDVHDRREAEERFRLVSEATSDVVFDMDLVDGTVWYSDGMEDLVGIRIEGRIDSAFARQGVHRDDFDRWQASLDAAVDGRVDTWSEEFRLVRADGSDVWVAGRGSVVRGPDGTATRFVGSLVDLTDRRLLEQRLVQAQRLEALGQLTGGIAHDFNNLLTVILGNADLLSEDLADHDDRQHLDLVEMTRVAAERGAQLTQRLLAFARRQPLEPAAIDVAALLGGLDGLLRRTLGEQIEIDPIRSTATTPVFADKVQLESAVLNICINARDAMPLGGKLTIEAADAVLDDEYVAGHEDLSAGEYVVVVISDTGVGMDSETAVKAFDPFFTTKGLGAGHGLGLSMVYGFAKQSGGHVRIYSEIDQGTVVRLYLPRAPQGAETVTLGRPTATLSGGSERILVVEDDDLVRALATTQLRGLGYDVADAADGPSALALVRSGPPFALLFTDVVMPGGVYGPELARAAREVQPELLVLYTSGYTENAIVHHGRVDPGVELISKPYRLDELAARVRGLLDGRAGAGGSDGASGADPSSAG